MQVSHDTILPGGIIYLLLVERIAVRYCFFVCFYKGFPNKGLQVGQMAYDFSFYEIQFESL